MEERAFSGLILFFFFFFVLLGPHSQPMEAPGLGLKLELQLLAYITAKATPDLSLIGDLPMPQLTARLDH